MRHQSTWRTLALLAILVWVVTISSATVAAADPIAVDLAESEPNDAQELADPITVGDTSATISPVGDVDYFRLSLVEGQRIYLAALAQCGTELEVTLAVLDAGGATLAVPEEWPDDNIVFEFIAPETADYYVRVSSDGSMYSPEELTGNYTLLVRNVPDDERNDRQESAAPINWGADIYSDNYAPYDLDYYRIHARPGDVIAVSLTVDEVGSTALRIDNTEDIYPYQSQHFIYEPGTASINFTVPFEADYTIRPLIALDHCEGLDFPQPYHLTVDRLSLHVGAAKAGKVDGVRFGTNDIMTRSATGQWHKIFDGGDVGITRALSGFEWMKDGSLLLSLKAGQSLPGVGKVTPQDIVKFTPTQLGDNTQGVFSLYLRGSRVGLTKTGERIDAIALLADDRLLLSTTGSASVPAFGGGVLGTRDEDLLLFHPDGSMPSAGTWSINMDGTRHLDNLGPYDLRVATVENDYEDPDFEPFYHRTTFWFSLNKNYTYNAWEEDGVQRFKAARGDLLYAYYYDTRISGPTGEVRWRPLTRAVLDFPRVITNVSIGP